MSEHKATISWNRAGREFTYEGYSRDHSWRFDGGTEVAATAAPAYLGNPKLVDPEEAFVASAASCHMLTFLAIAARKRWVIERYEDAAIGTLEKNADGRLAITRIVLRPDVRFGSANPPSAREIEHAHHQAHEHCFIASSVKSEIVVSPVTHG